MSPAGSADLSQLASDLAAAGGNARTIAAGLITNTANQIKTLAKAKAPRKTGALIDSIEVGHQGPLVAIIGPHVEYGVYQEFGVGQLGEFPTSGRRGFRAQPYMRPALTQALGPLADQMAEAGLLAITKGPRSTL